jgi:hypothetical protein
MRVSQQHQFHHMGYLKLLHFKLEKYIEKAMESNHLTLLLLIMKVKEEIFNSLPEK